MEENKFASELLGEIKRQSRRWFIAFILMVVLEIVTVAWFTLPTEETTKQVTVDGDEYGNANYFDNNEIGGDLNNGESSRKDSNEKETVIEQTQSSEEEQTALKRLQISDFVEWELEMFRRECNFTEEEMTFFNLRAKDIPIETIAEKMNVSVGKANKLSSKVKKKIIKVL